MCSNGGKIHRHFSVLIAHGAQQQHPWQLGRLPRRRLVIHLTRACGPQSIPALRQLLLCHLSHATTKYNSISNSIYLQYGNFLDTSEFIFLVDEFSRHLHNVFQLTVTPPTASHNSISNSGVPALRLRDVSLVFVFRLSPRIQELQFCNSISNSLASAEYLIFFMEYLVTLSPPSPPRRLSSPYHQTLP